MDFDVALAQQLAKICDFVYKIDPDHMDRFDEFKNRNLDTIGNPSKIIPIFDGLDTSLAGFQDGNHTSIAAVVRYSEKTVLAFQGTITDVSSASVKDWREDFRAEFDDKDIAGLELPGKIHIGFAHQLSLITKSILDNLPSDGLPLYVTGHSQGAAVAVLATKWLQLKQRPVKATYTFAAPRAGNAEFAASVDLEKTPVFRVEFGDDIVPHVPPAFLIKVPLLPDRHSVLPKLQPLLEAVAEGYVAVGPLTYRRLGMNLAINLNHQQEQELATVREGLLALPGAPLLENHAPFNYIGMFSEIQEVTAAENAADEAAEAAKNMANKAGELISGVTDKLAQRREELQTGLADVLKKFG
jgi:hypothetical protein